MCTEKLNALVLGRGSFFMYKQGLGYGSLMGNRLKQQEATKTYEVRSGSLYTKKMGTLVRNMKKEQESRRRDQ